MSGPFARPYVEALREVAGSLDDFEALVPPLDSLARTVGAVAGSHELRAFFLSPAVPKESKAAALDAVAGKLGISGLALRAAQILLSNRRIGRTSELVAAMRERIDRERRRVQATVVAAHELDGEATAAIAAALTERTGKTVRLSASVDPELLGGFVVRVGSEVWDSSLSRRLQKAKNALHAASGAAPR
jgi:F-type H+-transporting ATPase subunit delta